MNRSFLSIAVSAAFAACLQPVPPPPEGIVGPTASLVFSSEATPEGSISVVPFVVPGNSSVTADDYHQLHFVYRLASHRGEPIPEWAVLIFDRFEAGADQGRWRPAYAFGTAPTENFEGVTMKPVPGPEPLSSARDRLSNRTSFDGKTLHVMVLAKAPERTGFVFGLRVLNTTQGDDDPAARIDLDRSAPPARTVRQGAAISWLAQGSIDGVGYMVHTRDVKVQRVTGSSAADSFVVESARDTTRGWVYANAVFDVAARGGHYDFAADYRGRSMRASGATVDALVLADGGLAAWSHFVYRSGEGPTSIRLRLDYGAAPIRDDIQFFRFDVDVPLEELLGGPTFEQWRVRGEPTA